jgi:hypothetical protein
MKNHNKFNNSNNSLNNIKISIYNSNNIVPWTLNNLNLFSRFLKINKLIIKYNLFQKTQENKTFHAVLNFYQKQIKIIKDN